ncbi:hypothetical protein ABQJ54_03485 [Rhodanobacter sp. Si-c]|uniref:MFS transporter n=1 Tax=Rhodanobacter lycopersici TaxID=3162487 RepID=A0ABV3QB37_9GAMM
MSATVLPRPAGSQPAGAGGIHPGVILALAAWFVLVVLLGVSGAFVGRPGQPPVAIAIGVGAPLLLFFAWLRYSPSFRAFVLSLDLRLITAMQAWRWAGLGFLSLYAHGVLPAMFALPAGLGDMAVGFAAPWMILALVRRRDFAASRAFVRWNVLGMLDLAMAITLGTLSASPSTGALGEVTTAPMATLPLLVIPAFLVPLFLMLHTAALMQSRLIARSRDT